jgi:hypothetical protein
MEEKASSLNKSREGESFTPGEASGMEKWVMM